MSTPLTDAEKIRRLPWSIAHDATNYIFVSLTFFGTVFTLFLDELGLPKTQIGVLLSLLPFCGLLALFIAPWVARAGFKRTFLTFWGLRKVMGAYLLLTPWMLSHQGLPATFVYVGGVVLVFGICRAIGETAYYPWHQEIVPAYLRGRFTALASLVCGIAGLLTIGLAGYVLGHSGGLSRFMVLIAIGVTMGFISVWCALFIPGGAPLRSSDEQTSHLRGMIEALRDSNFGRYVAAICLSTLAAGFAAFFPLFMLEQVGLSQSMVVLLSSASLIAGMLSSYFWGWAADRYGSRPVMLSSMYAQLLFPIGLFIIPRHSLWSVVAAFSLWAMGGLIGMGSGIGHTRLLYVSLCPPAKRTQYMAVYYAAIGLMGGCGSLVAGRLLDYSQPLSGHLGMFALDPYTPTIAAYVLVALAAALVMRGVRAEATMPTGKFAGMFLRGHPLLAFQSLLRYNLARTEKARVSTTERLGEAHSPLTVDELIEALSDPSFNVRYEAIISIAHTQPDPKLIDCLVDVLGGYDPGLSLAAAWALGRIGDQRAIAPLRETLTSGYPLLQARSARALATLGDVEVIPLLLERLRTERDEGLRVAYASALGALGGPKAVDVLLDYLRDVTDEQARGELAFAVARTIGEEHHFIRLWRRLHNAMGTASCAAVIALKNKITNLDPNNDELIDLTDSCAQAFAEDDLARGTSLLQQIIGKLPLSQLSQSCATVLHECEARLDELGASRIEYVLLALHVMYVALNSE